MDATSNREAGGTAPGPWPPERIIVAATDARMRCVGGRDGLRETRERLEDLLGAYEEGEGSSDVEDVGTDEEYEVEEWDLE